MLEDNIFEEYLRNWLDSGRSPPPAPFNGLRIHSRSHLRHNPTWQRWISPSSMWCDCSRSPLQHISLSSLPMSQTDNITWMSLLATVTSSPTLTMADTIIASSAGAINECLLTLVPWSETTPWPPSSDHLADLDEEEEQRVTLRDVHAEIRLHQEEAAPATNTSQHLGEKNYSILLE
ncbi:hypothetical protein PR048_020694 [Dryococelus australis]|uniref:Uncharacterized protein n=1 Tax=Dryococelus australis TaxID=614101 RepID=A0ABQ9H761_9NEOP|nr:hypothetical protein PR048_020694 [Dryococelus australis]